MTSREKAASLGLPVAVAQSEVGGVQPIAWESDYNWHARVGTGQHITNVGLVLVSALANLKLRNAEKGDVFFTIDSPNFADGLTERKGGGYKVHIPTKEKALEAHKIVHVAQKHASKSLMCRRDIYIIMYR